MIEEQRDAHLREALRHAPDAQVQPPPGLSELILKEARAKARDASPPARTPRHPWLGIWDWLARPSVATGFAGVMVATLVGLIWWDQPMDEALPRSPVPAAAPAPAPQQAPAAIASPAAPALVAEAKAEHAAPQAAPRRAIEADQAEARQRKKEAPPPAAAKPAAPPERRADATAPQAREEVTAAPPPAAPSPAAAPPPAPSVADTHTANAGAAGSLAKSRPADEPKRSRAMAPAAEATGSMSGAPAQLDELSQSRVKAAPTLALLRHAIAAEPTRWSWQRDGGAPQAMNDAVRSWLARLDADAGDRWQPADASTPPPGREIRLLHDGQLQHGFRLTEGAVWWRQPQGAWQRVPMLPTSLSVLETSAP